MSKLDDLIGKLRQIGHEGIADEFEELLVSEPVVLRSMNFENGVLDIQVSHNIVKAIAIAMMNVLDEKDTPNYIEMTANHPNGSQVVLTLQRKSGKTPHELRKAAEDQLKEVREAYIEAYDNRKPIPTQRLINALEQIRQHA